MRKSGLNFYRKKKEKQNKKKTAFGKKKHRDNFYQVAQNTVLEDFSQVNPDSVLKSASARHPWQFYAMIDRIYVIYLYYFHITFWFR